MCICSLAWPALHGLCTVETGEKGEGTLTEVAAKQTGGTEGKSLSILSLTAVCGFRYVNFLLNITPKQTYDDNIRTLQETYKTMYESIQTLYKVEFETKQSSNQNIHFMSKSICS
jgi:hypothetical protein